MRVEDPADGDDRIQEAKRHLVFKEINDDETSRAADGRPSKPPPPSSLGRTTRAAAAQGPKAQICMTATVLAVVLVLALIFFQCFCPDAKLHVSFQCSKPEEIVF